MKDEQGFNLIELIILFAIITILIVISLSVYQNYTMKTRITTIIAELNSGKTQYELIISENSASGSNDFSVKNMFLAQYSEYCIYTVNAPGNTNQALVCQLKNLPVLNGEFVYLKRDAAGKWSCGTSVGIPDRYKPASCF